MQADKASGVTTREFTFQKLQEATCNLQRGGVAPQCAELWGQAAAGPCPAAGAPWPAAALSSQQLTAPLFSFRIYVSFFEISAANVGWNNTTFA